MRGIRGDRCSSCRRSFSGTSTWEKHFIGSGENRRCRTVKELRRNGLVRRADGIWTRRYEPSPVRQLRILRLGRPGIRRFKEAEGTGPDTAQGPREANPALTNEQRSGAA